MHLFVSLLYAPFVFLSLRYLDIKMVSGILFVLSAFWFLFLFHKKDSSLYFPLFYMLVAGIAYFLNDFLVLKMIPLLISSLFSLFILFSYLQHRSIILYFAEKFSKTPLCEKEKEYIQKSTFFWFLISVLNTNIHLMIYLDANLSFWLYYSSFGWYFLFAAGAIIQFFHRRYIFLRHDNV